MIPLRLHLTDFLSYREMPEPLELSGVHLACMSGPNGHGKSALLDAITWAIWGKARGCEGGQDQERLIRDGADAMRVEFVFELEGQTYRVARTRWRSGKGDIVFNVRAPDDSWTDLAGEGIADTQRRIVERLRMDYETFVTSAFILQGRADTFTRLDPRQRKDVLGKILGLEVYERLADRAREHKKGAQSEADGHARELDSLERDLAERDALADKRAAADAALAAAEAERTAGDEALARLRERTAELRREQAVEAETRKRRDEASAELAREVAEAARLAKEGADLEAAARIDADIVEIAARLAGLERDDTRLDELRARDTELRGEAASLEARIREERTRLEAQRDGHERSVAALERETAAETEARELLARAEAEVVSLDKAAADREALLARHAEIKQRIGAIAGERKGRDAERAETEEKQTLLGRTKAECPLCGEELTPAHRKEIRAAMTARLKELTKADRAASEQERALAAELTSLEKRGRSLRDALARRETIASQAAALRQQLERLGIARTELEAAREAAAEAATRLGGEDYATGERNKLARVREDIATAGYDPAAHRGLRAQLDVARKADRALAAAKHAGAVLAGTLREQRSAEERAARARDAVAAADVDLQALGERLEPLAGLLAQLAQAVEAAGRIQRRVEEAGRISAAATHALEALERKAVEAAAVRKKHALAKRTVGLFDKLAKAFGRDGIPARIIGNAIPELGQEANRLLALLSDGQMTISIDPIRETKTRGMKETLEVTVYDASSGKRPYEMYSGGERLRIDFALRVALSRLLANRAGARLETLVIDEGFGSQDTEGRLRLLEAVMRVRSEFRTVLVITHIDELKEHFPVRIEVRKDPGTGSQVILV